MKRLGGAQTEPRCKSVCNWHTRMAALMSIALLWGVNAFAEVHDGKNIPELPRLEVRAHWLEYNLTEPVLVKMLKPKLPPKLIGTEVVMQFRIETSGKARNIRNDARPFDDDECNLAAMMKSVLKSWRFTPSYDEEGHPVPVRVALPVKVVAKGKGNVEHYANIAIKKPVLLAVLD